VKIRDLRIKEMFEKIKRLFLQETEPGRAKVNRKALYWTVLIALVVFTVVLGSIRGRGKTKSGEKVVPVETDAVKTGSIEESIELTGWVRANMVTEVTSKVTGRLESLQLDKDDGTIVDVEEGVQVKKGQQIAVIDHNIYQAQVDAAKAAEEAAQVGLADAEREKRRILALFEGGSATEQSKDKAITTAELAATQLNSAKANLELAEINLQESTIRSPIDGIVIQKHIDVGNLINIGQRIVTVADINTVKLVVSAPERYVGQVKEGLPVKIKVDSYQEKGFEAKVYSVYPALDEQTHTIQVEIRLDNAKLLLKPGMYAKVTIVLKHKDDTVVIPRDVVLGGKVDEPYVYVVENGIAHKRIVKTGITEGANIEIIEGLKAGESLVVNGMNYLTDGIKVEAVVLKDIE
jgi:membrane fusion protein (multidrug efflux system)